MPMRINADRTFIRPLLATILGVSAAVLAFQFFKHDPSRTQLECDFTQQQPGAAVVTPSGNRNITNLRLDGSLEAGADGLASFRGTANWQEARAVSGAVSGGVFLAGDSTITGLALNIDHPDFGHGSLTIATLNEGGMLDSNPNTAFLFFLVPEKLSHPVNYTCRIAD